MALDARFTHTGPLVGSSGFARRLAACAFARRHFSPLGWRCWGVGIGVCSSFSLRSASGGLAHGFLCHGGKRRGSPKNKCSRSVFPFRDSLLFRRTAIVLQTSFRTPSLQATILPTISMYSSGTPPTCRTCAYRDRLTFSKRLQAYPDRINVYN